MSAQSNPEFFAHKMSTEQALTSPVNVQAFLQALNQNMYKNGKGVKYDTYVTVLANQSMPKFTEYLFKLLELNKLTNEQALQLANISIAKFKEIKDAAGKDKVAAPAQKAPAVIQVKPTIIVKSEPQNEDPIADAADAGQIQAMVPAASAVNAGQIQAMVPATSVVNAGQIQAVVPATSVVNAGQIQAVVPAASAVNAGQIQAVVPAASAVNAGQIQAVVPAASAVNAGQIQAVEPAGGAETQAEKSGAAGKASTGKRPRPEPEDEQTDEDDDTLIVLNSQKSVTVKEFKRMTKQSLQVTENKLVQEIKTKMHETEYSMANYQDALKTAERFLAVHNRALQAYAEASEVHAKFIDAINTYRGDRH